MRLTQSDAYHQYLAGASAAEQGLAETVDRMHEPIDQSQLWDLIDHSLHTAPDGALGAVHIAGALVYTTACAAASAAEGEDAGRVALSAGTGALRAAMDTVSAVALASGSATVGAAVKVASGLIGVACRSFRPLSWASESRKPARRPCVRRRPAQQSRP